VNGLKREKTNGRKFTVAGKTLNVTGTQEKDTKCDRNTRKESYRVMFCPQKELY
jgi:hypothetical protein